MMIAHIADTHLGYRWGDQRDPATGRNARAVDFELAFELVVSDIIRQGVDLVVHAGDVFHSPRPSWAAMGCFVHQMNRLVAAHIPVCVIAGNHDMPRLRQEVSPFDLLRQALPEVTFAAEYEPVAVHRAGAWVHLLPHGALLTGNRALFPVAEMGPNILVVHGTTADVPRGVDREAGELEIGVDLLGDEWDYVALGHFHRHHRAGPRAWYAGATERCGFSDEGSVPGWALVTLAPNAEPVVEHRIVPARPMVTLAPIDCRIALSTEDVVLEVHRRLGTKADDGVWEQRAHTNARLPLLHADHAVRSEVQRTIANCGQFGYWSLRIAVERPKRKGDERTTEGVTEKRREGHRLDLGSLLVEYAATIKRPEEFRAAFIEKGRQALEQAAEMAPVGAEE